MNADIALVLAQDGVVNGAIYALIALALVLVYAVTRIIWVPQGEFVAFAALSLASLELGRVPGTVWLLLTGAAAVVAVEFFLAARARSWSRALKSLCWYGLLPCVIAGLTFWLAPQKPPLAVQALLTAALVVPLGPMTYRLAFQPIANASVLVLLIVAVAVHFVYVGLGLVFFGAEGFRTTPISSGGFELGAMTVSGQSLWVLGASIALIGVLYAFFEHTLKGKALRATAVNRTGARLVGISTTFAGLLCFGLAALIGVVSGILISPLTTIYYDTGFLVGLKAFVGAIIGSLVSYPIAAAGAVLVGLLESYASFWASGFKEVIVFALIIPVLLWRSLTSHAIEEEEDDE